MAELNQEAVIAIAGKHLGKVGGEGYKDTYDPGLLVEIPRYLNREAYGIDENNNYNPYDPSSKVKYFYNEDYNICIFNGWKRKKNKDGTYKLDDDGYKGFEKYFND